jgi:hypothetical protein
MTQQPSDYPVADPGDQPEGAGTFLEDGDDAEVEPKADAADLAEQKLPPPGDEEEDALDLRADRAARTDADRPA